MTTITMLFVVAGLLLLGALIIDTFEYRKHKSPRKLLTELIAAIIFNIPLTLLIFCESNKNVISVEQLDVKWDEKTKSHLVFYYNDKGTISSFNFEKRYGRAYAGETIMSTTYNSSIWIFKYPVVTKHDIIEPEIL